MKGQTWPSTRRKALTSHPQAQRDREAGLASEVLKQETPPGSESDFPGPRRQRLKTAFEPELQRARHVHTKVPYSHAQRKQQTNRLRNCSCSPGGGKQQQSELIEDEEIKTLVNSLFLSKVFHVLGIVLCL